MDQIFRFRESYFKDNGSIIREDSDFRGQNKSDVKIS